MSSVGQGAIDHVGHGRRDQGQAFTAVGRSDNLLKIRTRFLDPAIVEGICAATEGIEEACLLAHEGVLHLFLVGDPGRVAVEELAASLVEAAGTHAKPATVRFVEKLERTPSGKIKEGALRALLP